MDKKKVLICGHRSFASTGLSEMMETNQIMFDCFSRGNEEKVGNVITGDVMFMTDNKYLDNYDTVVNFIILKEKSIEENIEYLKVLLDFCKRKKVKHLIQISSISVYPNEAVEIDEHSSIESDWHNKGGYARIKVAVDKYIESNVPEGIKVSYVRPGFIYTKNKEISKAGILISKFGINILLGDKKTTLPLINREILHEAIIRIIKAEEPKKVYLILNKDKETETKYKFVRNQWNVLPICLPYWLIMGGAKLMKFIGILNQRSFQKFVGLFKRTWFNSTESERNLNMSFGKRKFAVLGAGTYGSYIANLLSIIYPHERIDLYDVGDENLKTEKEMGYLSHIVGASYEGLQKGRFFGFGGASVKWGGQLLTFTNNDFLNPTQYMKDIVDIDMKYKDTVLERFGLENNFPEERINEKLFTKTGVWLSYFHRDFYKHFKISKNKKIHVVSNARVTKILADNDDVMGFEYVKDSNKYIAAYDNYFLTTGAFESSRLLINSGLSRNNNMVPFSDHLSQRAFKIKSGIKMGEIDFRFIVRGASLLTKRFVGEVDGYSFYSQPICNENFPFFRDLKKLLFGHKLRVGLIFNVIKNIPSCIAFAWYMIVLKKMYVHKGEFFLQIDIEAPRASGKITLNDEKDNYGEKSIDVDLSILPKTGELFTKARAIIKDYLDNNGVEYEELPFSTSAEHYEDVYHPFGMFSDFNNIEDYFSYFKNMLVVNTGILPRAGGINSTCAVLPLVEEYIHHKLK